MELEGGDISAPQPLGQFSTEALFLLACFSLGGEDFDSWRSVDSFVQGKLCFLLLFLGGNFHWRPVDSCFSREATTRWSRPSRREVRILVFFFPVLYFSREPSPNKGVQGQLGTLNVHHSCSWLPVRSKRRREAPRSNIARYTAPAVENELNGAARAS